MKDNFKEIILNVVKRKKTMVNKNEKLKWYISKCSKGNHRKN